MVANNLLYIHTGFPLVFARVFGIRLGTLIFSTIVTVGQFVYAFGALIDAFWVMQLGRFIFGVGGESLAVAQNAYTVSWFKGKELNTVFGLQLSMARIGSTVNFLVMEPIYNWVNGMEDGHTTLGISLIIGKGGRGGYCDGEGRVTGWTA